MAAYLSWNTLGQQFDSEFAECVAPDCAERISTGSQCDEPTVGIQFRTG